MSLKDTLALKQQQTSSNHNEKDPEQLPGFDQGFKHAVAELATVKQEAEVRIGFPKADSVWK